MQLQWTVVAKAAAVGSVGGWLSTYSAAGATLAAGFVSCADAALHAVRCGGAAVLCVVCFACTQLL